MPRTGWTLETIGAWLRAAPFCKGRRRAGSQFSIGPGEPGNAPAWRTEARSSRRCRGQFPAAFSARRAAQYFRIRSATARDVNSFGVEV